MVASKSTIIPVFHDVDPSELRWPQSGDGVESIIRCLCPCLLGEKGRYARDLHMLQKKTTLDPHTNKKKPRHESSTLQKWRKALSDVSNKSGSVFNAYNGLIAVLSRNLREEFMPFLHKLMETMGNLLESGGDRDPEILEQVFTAFSYILKYMQKLLVKDIAYVMK